MSTLKALVLEDIVSEEVKNAAIPLSPKPSDGFFNAASPRPKPSGGLSELSKQLRILQAKNQTQTVEIDRLERQLRLIADLQGISVSDLQAGLRRACEAEAYGELQGQIKSLRAELEAARAKASVSSVAQDEANSKKIANLELRVGELEEVEEKQRTEIKTLYSQLMEFKENVTRLESMNEHYLSENEQLKLELEQQKHTEGHSPGRITFVTNVSGGEAEPMRRTQLSRAVEAGAQSTSATIAATAAIAATYEAEMEAQILRQKLDLTQQQQKAAEEQSKLRNSQYKARFMVQEENVADLHQQLLSLYAAYEFLKQEKAEDDEARLELQTYLGQADAEVARQVRDLDRTHFGCKTTVKDFTTSTVLEESTELSSMLKPVVASRLLIKSSAGVIKKWKSCNVLMFSTLTHHILEIEKRRYDLEFGVSKVELYPKRALGFSIHLGPGRAVIHAAGINEQDFHRWMSALTYATTGAEYYGGRDVNATAANECQSLAMAPTTADAVEEKTDLNHVSTLWES